MIIVSMHNIWFKHALPNISVQRTFLIGSYYERDVTDISLIYISGHFKTDINLKHGDIFILIW